MTQRPCHRRSHVIRPPWRLAAAVGLVAITAAACARTEQLGSESTGGGPVQREVSLARGSAASGSGGGEIEDAVGPRIDPCSLLTAFEVETVVGAAASSPQRDATPILVGMPMCNFANNPGVPDPGPPFSVALGVWTRSSSAATPTSTVGSPPLRAASARGAFEGYLRFNEPFGITSVDGLGDDALWDDKLGTLVILQDDKVIGITVFFSHPDAPDRRKTATEIFKIVLPRLPQEP